MPDILVFNLLVFFSFQAPAKWQAICHCHEFVCILISGYFSFYTICMNNDTTQSSIHWEHFSLPLSFKATTKGGCREPTIYFQLAFTYRWTHLQSKVGLFSLPSVDHAESPIQPRVWAEEGPRGTMGALGYCSCSFLLSSGPVYAQPWIFILWWIAARTLLSYDLFDLP